MGRSRDIAAFLGKTEADNSSNRGLLNSSSSVGLDSATVISIIDSDYVTARAEAGVDVGKTYTYSLIFGE